MLRILAAEALLSLAVFALQEVPRGAGWITLALIGAVAAALPALLACAHGRSRPPGAASGRLLLWGGGACAVAQLGYALARTVKPKVIDIGETTLAAVNALAHGGNPYALPIDRLAGGLDVAGAAFHGYKYLPVMLAAYAPFCLTLGIRGIVVANMLLQGAAAALLGALAARGGGRAAGLAAAAFYLSLPFPAFQLLARGVNDLVAVVPLLVALLLLDRRPGWAGLMVGLSIGAKLMPGLAVLPCLLPAPGGRRRYLLGAAAGLLPILPFAAASPDAFTANIVLFNALRPIDDTSWLYGLPALAAVAARAVALAALAWLYARIWRRPPARDARIAASLIAILIVFSVGPDMHHNYYLWFIPLLAALAGRAAIGAAAGEPR